MISRVVSTIVHAVPKSYIEYVDNEIDTACLKTKTKTHRITTEHN